MPSEIQFERWGEDQIRAGRFVGKTVKEFSFGEANDGRDERLTILFTDNTALVIESRVTQKESWLILGARGEDGAPIRVRKVIIE
jgi:hypothetical protein